MGVEGETQGSLHLAHGEEGGHGDGGGTGHYTGQEVMGCEVINDRLQRSSNGVFLL